MRVFAGRRLDSFFLDFQRIAKGQLDPDVVGKIRSEQECFEHRHRGRHGQGVWSQEGSMFAVVGKSSRSTSDPR